MQDAENLLETKRLTDQQYEMLDRQVKYFLERVWMERSRWIVRRNEERQATRQAQEEEIRRGQGIMAYYAQQKTNKPVNVGN